MQRTQVQSLVRELDPTCHNSRSSTATQINIFLKKKKRGMATPAASIQYCTRSFSQGTRQKEERKEEKKGGREEEKKRKRKEKATRLERKAVLLVDGMLWWATRWMKS